MSLSKAIIWYVSFLDFSIIFSGEVSSTFGEILLLLFPIFLSKNLSGGKYTHFSPLPGIQNSFLFSNIPVSIYSLSKNSICINLVCYAENTFQRETSYFCTLHSRKSETYLALFKDNMWV